MEDRCKYIGGTDAAAILGLSRWKTQLEVWAEKTGRVQPEDISNKLSVKLGNRLEDTVAELFMEETGKKVRRVNKTLYHPHYTFLGANIDRDVVGEEAILECKTCSAWKAKEWAGEEIPQEYILQVVHYLAVTGAHFGYIACLIGNQEFKWQMITRDDDLIRDLVSKEVAFWNDFIVPQVMPAQIQAGDTDILYRMFPISDPNKDIILNDEANIKIEQINSMTQDKISLDAQIEQHKNELKALLGDNESGRTTNWRITWKTQNKKEYTVKASSTRVLRYSPLKGE